MNHGEYCATLIHSMHHLALDHDGKPEVDVTAGVIAASNVYMRAEPFATNSGEKVPPKPVVDMEMVG